MKKSLLHAILGSAAHAADWRPAQLPQAEETTITSAHTGRSYRIQTSTIGAAPPAAGCARDKNPPRWTAPTGRWSGKSRFL